MNEKSSFAFFNLSDNVNLISIIGAIVIFLAVFIVTSNAYKQMKQKRAEVEMSGHFWDGIGEYKNPLPLGWALMFVILIIFAVWYFLAGYPLDKYSSIGEYNEEVEAYNAKYNAKYEQMSDEQKIAMGESVFMVQCAPCHGLEGGGMDGKAQDLTRWGGVNGIIYTLKHGSAGLGYEDEDGVFERYAFAMPKGGSADEDTAITNEEDMKAVATYIVSELSKSHPSKDSELLAKGKELYDETCMSCHGEEGEGGAAGSALNEYGTYKFVVNVLKHGKKVEDPSLKEDIEVIGDMPSFGHVLSKNQMEAVAHYITYINSESKE